MKKITKIDEYKDIACLGAEEIGKKITEVLQKNESDGFYTKAISLAVGKHLRVEKFKHEEDPVL